MLLRALVGLLVATVVSTATVVLLFDWDASELATGVPIGLAVWGTLSYVTDISSWIPSREVAPPRPAAVVDDELWRGIWWRWLVGAPLLVPFAWLVDRWDLGAVFVPGQFAGFAAAHLVGLMMVTRWERAHRSRLVTNEGYPDAASLYALSR